MEEGAASKLRPSGLINGLSMKLWASNLNRSLALRICPASGGHGYYYRPINTGEHKTGQMAFLYTRDIFKLSCVFL